MGIRLGLLSVLAAAATGCGGGNAASRLAQAPRFSAKGQTKCGVEASQARPLIVEWPSADRQVLESKVHGGVVAVRYHGCEMDVLTRCSVPGRYGYLGTTHALDRVVVRDEDDLYANLPVGAARLEGKLQRSGQLTVDMSLVGRYEAERASVRVDELSGECAGATHFIYGVSVGAFDFYAGADAAVGGGVGVGGLGAGGQSLATRETLTKNGDPAACAMSHPDDKAPPAECGALIRIEVVPLGEARPAPAPAATPPGIVDFPDVPSPGADGLSVYCDGTTAGAHFCTGLSNVTSTQASSFSSSCTMQGGTHVVNSCPGGAVGCCTLTAGSGNVASAAECYYCGTVADYKASCNSSSGGTWTTGDAGSAPPCNDASSD